MARVTSRTSLKEDPIHSEIGDIHAALSTFSTSNTASVLSDLAALSVVRVVVHGDSNTKATYDGGAIEGWGQRLADTLDSLLPGTVALQNSAMDAYVSLLVLDNLAAQVSAYSPHIVAIMVGTNDAWVQVNGWRTDAVDFCGTEPSPGEWTTDGFKARISRIADGVAAMTHGDTFNGGKPLLVLVSPPWACKQSDKGGLGDLWCRDQPTLVEYKGAVREVATDKGAVFVDAQTPVGTLPVEQYEDWFVTADGVHLEGVYQQLITDLIISALSPSSP